MYGPDVCLTRTAKILLAVASAYHIPLEAINRSHSFKCALSPSSDTIQPVIITRETLPSKETQEIVHQHHPLHTKIASMTSSLSLNSTRPEDMFNFSLNFAGFLKGSLDVHNNETESIQQQQQQQQPSSYLYQNNEIIHDDFNQKKSASSIQHENSSQGTLSVARPSFNEMEDPNNATPEMEGWLYKQGDKYKHWNKRWFVLKGSNLFYFKSPKVYIYNINKNNRHH